MRLNTVILRFKAPPFCASKCTSLKRLLRKRLRAAFNESALPSTVDHRYVLTTAHATLMRFVNPSDEIAAFTQFIRQSRDCFDEVQVVDQIELVLNDWCHQQQNTKLIRSFKLGHEAA